MKHFSKILAIVLLFCTLDSFGQSSLHVEHSTWDFGRIEEAEGVVRCRFEGKNLGKEPTVILSVGVSCGCTTPTFSRKPILPGEDFSLEVEFDPSGRPGPFEKELVLYDAKQQTVRLRIRGEVIPRKRRVEECYPIVAGGGVRLTQNYLPMGNLRQDESRVVEVGIVNTATEVRHLHFASEQPSRFITLSYPRTLQPGEQGEILVECEIPISSLRYGTLEARYRLEVGEAKAIPFTIRGIVVDNPEQVISEEGAPRAVPSSQNIRLGERPLNGGVQRSDFTLQNTGTTPLILRAVECSEGVGCSLKAGEVIPAGGSVRAEVTMNPTYFNYGAAIGRILLVTNEPERPTHQLRVSAIFID